MAGAWKPFEEVSNPRPFLALTYQTIRMQFR